MSALGAIATMPAAVAQRTRDEAVGIWTDARELRGRGNGSSESADPVRAPSAEQVYLAWYGGLALMAGLRVIEWRLAAIIAAIHTVERYGHRRRVQDFVEGLGAGV